MKSLLIDHDDSFTHNLKHWLKPLFQEITVIHHRKLQEISDFNSLVSQIDLVVLSPGPKNPKNYPHTLRFLKEADSRSPTYGVCLGLQMMAVSCGFEVSTYAPPRHGKTSALEIQHPDFLDFKELKVARYHSIKVDLPKESDFQILATSKDDQHPMWLQHKIKKWMGVQYHPESFLTESPELHLAALKNWLNP